MSALAFAAGGRTQGIQLGCERGLRLDEGTTIVAHGLVACVGVLGEKREAGRNKEHDEEDKREDSVVDEEDHTHNTRDDGLRLSVT